MPERWGLFDLNGTLLDPATMADAFGGGATAEALVHGALDDAVAQAMADTLAGGFRPLPEYLEAALRRRCRLGDHDEDGVPRALELARTMRPFPEAVDALCALGAAGWRLGVVTNSARDSAAEALGAAGLDGLIELLVGVDEVGAFKPAPAVYHHAVQCTGAAAGDVTLVAAHWWDVLGAKRAGLCTAWVARRERELLATVPAPDAQGEDLLAVARALTP